MGHSYIWAVLFPAVLNCVSISVEDPLCKPTHRSCSAVCLRSVPIAPGNILVMAY